MSLDAVDTLQSELAKRITAVPAGAWAVGVSGGADSVALLRMLHVRPDLRLYVVHLDHQTRGQASTDDAGFVRVLAAQLGLPCVIRLRERVELADAPANPSARYRAARIALFRDVVAREHLQGVILAHHADDQAETVLSRLLRGSGWPGLGGMRARSTIGELTLLRPLLDIPRDALRAWLRSIAQPWREDASNASMDYQRNRLRQLLADRPDVVKPLLEFATKCRALQDWVRSTAPTLPPRFDVTTAVELPSILARESLRRWLISAGVPAEELSRSPQSVDRLLQMATDAASPPRAHFPGAIEIRRRKGRIEAAGDSTRAVGDDAV